MGEQVFEVVHTMAMVRNSPATAALPTGQRKKGEQVFGVEETFDGWVRLKGGGYIIKDMRGKNGIGQLLRPVSGQPMYAVQEHTEVPGPQRFQVVLKPSVAVRDVPSKDGKIVGARSYGEDVWAARQTYNQWVRLLDGSGWMLTFKGDLGPLLQPRFVLPLDEVEDLDELEERRQPGSLTQDSAAVAAALKRQAVPEADEANQQAALARRKQEQDAEQARRDAMEEERRRMAELAAEKEQKKIDEERKSKTQEALANQQEEEQRKAEEEQLEARKRKEAELKKMWAERDEKQRKEDEELRKKAAEEARLRAEEEAKAKEAAAAATSQEHAELLQRFREAVITGDAGAIKTARDVCKKAGVTTKDIGKVFAQAQTERDNAAS